MQARPNIESEREHRESSFRPITFARISLWLTGRSVDRVDRCLFLSFSAAHLSRIKIRSRVPIRRIYEIYEQETLFALRQQFAVIANLLYALSREPRKQ